MAKKRHTAEQVIAKLREAEMRRQFGDRTAAILQQRFAELRAADTLADVHRLTQRVVVTAPPDSQHLDLDIHWVGGFTSHHTLVRPVARYEQLDNYPQLQARILELRDQKQTSARIAAQLNRENFRPATPPEFGDVEGRAGE